MDESLVSGKVLFFARLLATYLIKKIKIKFKRPLIKFLRYHRAAAYRL